MGFKKISIAIPTLWRCIAGREDGLDIVDEATDMTDAKGSVRNVVVADIVLRERLLDVTIFFRIYVALLLFSLFGPKPRSYI